MKTDIVIAAWGQVVQPKTIQGPPKDAMDLMVQASFRAGKKLKNPVAIKDVDGIMVVKSLSTHFDSPATDLATRIGAKPRFTHVSQIGGNSPQTLINKAAGMIARKELNAVLVAGTEAYVQRSETCEKPDSALLRGIPETYQGDDAIGTSPVEISHGIEHPMQGFPLFETALWAESGMGLSDYMNKIAGLWADFSKVAASHPHAWSRTPRTPEEILGQGPSNRPIAFPYNKFMNAFVTVDQAAALILMSGEYAEKLGQCQGKTVYFLGGGYARDRQRFMVEKSDFTSSPPLKAAVDKALYRSGLKLSHMDCFDLYSCFPCSVSIAKKMISIPDYDPRPLTLTGGLGFFGGPGNNYNLHAIATLAELISGGKKTTGLVTALGWFMYKHAAGIYSSLIPSKALDSIDIEDENDCLAGPEPVELDPAPAGNGRIETYTIIHNRDHSPAYAVLYGRTEKGLRFIARTDADHAVFHALSSRSMVGKPVALFSRPDNKDTLVSRTIARLIDMV